MMARLLDLIYKHYLGLGRSIVIGYNSMHSTIMILTTLALIESVGISFSITIGAYLLKMEVGGLTMVRS